MLMGIGNLTELTAADSTGVNALLIAVCQELGIRTVLTTEVIPWARGAVREVDVARRLMHYAVTKHTVPKGVDDRLVTVKDPVVLSYSEEELRALQAEITDPELPHLRRRRDHHRLQQRALRSRHRHPDDLRAARRGRSGARLLSRQGAGESEPRGDARQDLSSGRCAGLGLSDAAG